MPDLNVVKSSVGLASFDLNFNHSWETWLSFRASHFLLMFCAGCSDSGVSLFRCGRFSPSHPPLPPPRPPPAAASASANCNGHCNCYYHHHQHHPLSVILIFIHLNLPEYHYHATTPNTACTTTTNNVLRYDGYNMLQRLPRFAWETGSATDNMPIFARAAKVGHQGVPLSS